MIRRTENRLTTQPQKPVWWKTIMGTLLIFIEVKNHVHLAANLLKANNRGEQLGMNIPMVALIAIGCWLYGNRPNLPQDQVN